STKLRACRTARSTSSSTRSRLIRSLCSRWMSLVAMKVWIRGFAAHSRARADDFHAEPLELARKGQLFGEIHAAARGLFTVPQCGVEDANDLSSAHGFHPLRRASEAPRGAGHTCGARPTR